MAIVNAYIRAGITKFFCAKKNNKRDLVYTSSFSNFKVIFILLAKVIAFFI